MEWPLGLYRLGMNDQYPRCVARETHYTNYLGNAGRFLNSAANLGLNTTPTQTAQVDGYRGLFLMNRQAKMGDVTDGTSNTVMFGEVTGNWTDGIRPLNRTHSFSWTSSALPMNRMTFSITDGTPFNNNIRSLVRFSSLHSGGIINVCLGDGSVKSMTTQTDNNVYLSMSGAADGSVVANAPE